LKSALVGMTLVALSSGLQHTAQAQCSLPAAQMPVSVITGSGWSMLPNLTVGEALGARCYSRPAGFDGPNTPDALSPHLHLGDVILFRLPRDNTSLWVKRVVGLPGDAVRMHGGRLILNGVEVDRQPDGNYQMSDDPPVVLRRYTETLPNGVSYGILKASDDGPLDNTDVYHVPPGCVFVMGDSRDDSLDSRVLDDVGYIPLDNLVARILADQ
jgi:signal peptidase I